MGFWNTFIATFLVTDRVQKSRAAKKANREPIIVDAETVEPGEVMSYDLWTEEDSVTVDVSLTTRGPPVGIELVTAADNQRLMRGEDVDPIARNEEVQGETEHEKKVGDGQYALNVYRHPDSPDEPSDFEITVRMY